VVFILTGVARGITKAILGAVLNILSLIPMKIQYCSDLHLEFRETAGFWKAHPIEVLGEVLLLAGDILPFPPAQTVFVNLLIL